MRKKRDSYCTQIENNSKQQEHKVSFKNKKKLLGKLYACKLGTISQF